MDKRVYQKKNFEKNKFFLLMKKEKLFFQFRITKHAGAEQIEKFIKLP